MREADGRAQTNARILGIAPYEGMRAAMERAAQAYPDVRMDVYTGDLDAGVEIVRRMQQDAYDCIISRGGTAELIRGVTELPVVEIQISVYDVLSAIKLAENYARRYAIVGFPSVTEPAHILCDLLRYPAEILTVHSATEAQEKLIGLKEAGHRMVICDMVTHGIARQMEMDAFLITSGMESLQEAIGQARHIGVWFGRLRRENLFLRSAMLEQNGCIAALDNQGRLFYSRPDVPEDLREALCAHLKDAPAGGAAKFYHTQRGRLYGITAQTLSVDGENCHLFYCVPSRIPLHTHWSGIRPMNRGECEYLFVNSFYSVSGAMGALDTEVNAIAMTRQPVLIVGEPGTGKEQIARYLYLHSLQDRKPFVQINCGLMNDKSWDFLLAHHNSPLNELGNTVYFQNLEEIPDGRIPQLLAAILETGLARRVRLLFSCVAYEAGQLPEPARRLASRLGCLILELPPLRSRSDEIPALASLYLNSLNQELGKQISGLEPRAIEMLRQYDWPHNYTQFKHVLQTLAALTDAAYIRSSLVAELLAKERASGTVRRAAFLHQGGGARADGGGRTLEEIISDAVRQAMEANRGNRAAAARQLGISRTTLWRYLGSISAENPRGSG